MKEGEYMAKSLPDIIYDKTKVTPIVDARASLYQIPYFKDSEYFSNFESYNAFIKGCERLVRSNVRYKNYIRELKERVRLNRCQVLKNVTDDEADIEMHHGPIFTLYDYCAIITEYFLMRKWKISTPRIAAECLSEHERHRIQIVMVSSTIHEEIHARNIFINQQQAFGDLNSFLYKYADAVSDEYREKLNRYIDRSLLMDSNDFGVLSLNKALLEGSKL